MLRHRRAQCTVDLFAGEAGRVEARAADARAVEHVGRPVALVRDRHQLLLQSQRNADLGRAGEERCNAHQRAPAASSRSFAATSAVSAARTGRLWARWKAFSAVITSSSK